IEFFKQELVNRPRSEYLHFALAELLMLKGDTLNAINTYEILLSMNPNYENVQSYLKQIKSSFYKGKKSK
ncbi:MAG: hypothetical protein N2203_08755, partial [Bacteroidia bacterium]|nr:hypothetical protein [Bacteroidia bacterium]